MKSRTPDRRNQRFPALQSGCTLGDICAEWLVFAFPAIAIAFAWRRNLRRSHFCHVVRGLSVRYALGIIFQYFTIAPMRGLSLGKISWQQ
jgi:hypothetical protein